MRESSPGWHGVVPILVTPFDDHSRVDEESLRRLVEFNIEAGVHGLGVALGSEVFRLSEAERAAIVQCYHNDLSHEEAAVVLGCPVGTVKTHILRAKQKLKARLGAWAPG